ncbi:hypothetical protein DFH27DRAFT_481699, partial [Peziza echinospora]
MVSRVLHQSPGLGARTLLLLHFAYRPLSPDEVQHALGIEMDETTEMYSTELDKSDIPSLQVVLKRCLGLVIADEESKSVRFVHYTLDEYFKRHGSTLFPNGYSTMSKLCLTYLNL